MTEIDEFESGMVRFEESVGGAQAVMGAFAAEMRGVQAAAETTGNEVSALSRGLNRGLKSSLSDVVLEGEKLSDALRGLGRTMLKSAFNGAVNPVMSHASGVLASGVKGLLGDVMPFADGGSFTQGRVTPVATGGIVSGPALFPMRGGAGLMGEAGPEAIMPLARGPDGKLGVRGQGGGTVHVVMNIQTPDAEGFKRSQSQIAAQMSRALSRADRNR